MPWSSPAIMFRLVLSIDFARHLTHTHGARLCSINIVADLHGVAQNLDNNLKNTKNSKSFSSTYHCHREHSCYPSNLELYYMRSGVSKRRKKLGRQIRVGVHNETGVHLWYNFRRAIQ